MYICDSPRRHKLKKTKEKEKEKAQTFVKFICTRLAAWFQILIYKERAPRPPRQSTVQIVCVSACIEGYVPKHVWKCARQFAKLAQARKYFVFRRGLRLAVHLDARRVPIERTARVPRFPWSLASCFKPTSVLHRQAGNKQHGNIYHKNNASSTHQLTN
jgi:hypothetical protein